MDPDDEREWAVAFRHIDVELLPLVRAVGKVALDLRAVGDLWQLGRDLFLGERTWSRDQECAQNEPGGQGRTNASHEWPPKVRTEVCKATRAHCDTSSLNVRFPYGSTSDSRRNVRPKTADRSRL